MKRKDANSKYKWDFRYLYKSEKNWIKDLSNAKNLLKKITTFKGKLNNKDQFFKYIDLDKEIDIKLTKLAQYLHYADIDTTDINFQKLSGMYSNELNSVLPDISFVSNEIKEIGFNTISEWLKSNDKYKEYLYPYECFFRETKHLLDNKSEELLAKVSQSRSNIYSMYDKLAFADRKKVFIKYNDKTVELNASIYKEIIEHSDPIKDQDLRIEATKKLNYNLIDNKHTLAAIYEGIIQYSFENVKLRNYNSCLQKSLSKDNVDVKIYENLIKIGKKHSNLFVRYCQIIKKHYKFKKFYSTDRSLKLVKEINTKYNIEEAQAIIKESLKPLGTEYLGLLEVAWSNNKIDYYEDTNKRTGAYSSGGNGFDPIILMNWDDTINSVNTLAHEIGHSVHTLFSDKSQPFALANYPIILAEVASTVNEHLLFDYLYNKSNNKSEKIFLLQNRILDIMNTFFRQIHFADFEWSAHKLVEKGTPLNSENLADLFSKISDEFGYKVFDKLDGKPYSWPRISHFYHSPFYVYKYATCILASYKLFKDVKDKKEINLINFLKSGRKKDPLDILKDCGVDYTDSKLYSSLIDELTNMLNQLEKLLK